VLILKGFILRDCFSFSLFLFSLHSAFSPVLCSRNSLQKYRSLAVGRFSDEPDASQEHKRLQEVLRKNENFYPDGSFFAQF